MASLVKAFASKPITNVRFTGTRISFDYDGKRVSYAVRKRDTVFVGNWNRQGPEVYYDKLLKGKLEIEALCIHEAIEKYVTETYGLDVDEVSHRIAQAIEKNWYEKQGRDWTPFSGLVTKIWKKHGSH